MVGMNISIANLFLKICRSIYIITFSFSSVILFYVGWWHRNHAATYEAAITSHKFTVKYPGSTMWSFDVKVSDIKRFEHRNTLSHTGNSIGESGILLNDGSFHEISMNYGNNINDMYDAVKTINSNVTFPKKVNKKVFGPLDKNYDE